MANSQAPLLKRIIDSLLDIQPLRTTVAHIQLSFNIYPSICKSSARTYLRTSKCVYMYAHARTRVQLCVPLKSAGKPAHLPPTRFSSISPYSRHSSSKQIPQLQNRKARDCLPYLLSFTAAKTCFFFQILALVFVCKDVLVD